MNVQFEFQVLVPFEGVLEQNLFQKVRIQVIVYHLGPTNLFVLVLGGGAHIPGQRVEIQKVFKSFFKVKLFIVIRN